MATIIESFPAIEVLQTGVDASVYMNWLIDIKALLQRHQLWKFVIQKRQYTAGWDEKDAAAAGMIAPFLSKDFKEFLGLGIFDSGFALISSLNMEFEVHFNGDGDLVDNFV